LWAAAGELAREHGINRTAKALHLEYGKLKQWAEAADVAKKAVLKAPPRYLILPWVSVPHLASHVLVQMARRIAADWEQIYGHPTHLLETSVDPERYRGACYRAANWTVMGRTTGRGKNCPSRWPNRSIKEVPGYPLLPCFRQLLA
jgi:hypothetical protein